MLAANDKITMRQLQILIVLGAMGTGMVVLPRRVAAFAGQDGWVIVIGLGVLGILAGALMSAAVSAASKIKPGAGFVTFAGALLTKPVAYVCAAGLWLRLVFVAGLELRAFMEMTRWAMLPQTPGLAVSIAVLLVCAYGAAKGMEALARTAEVLLGVMALPFIFLMAFAFFNVDFANLQPVFAAPPQDLFQGTLYLGFIFSGLECLLLVSPYIKKQQVFGRRVVGALGFAGGILLLITLLTLAKFGSNITSQPWPVLRMMDMISLPGAFTMRQEALMFGFWVITAFVFGSLMIFFAGDLLRSLMALFTGDLFKLKPRAGKMHILITVGGVFAVSVFPWKDIYWALDFMYITGGVFFMVVLPILLLAAAKLRKGATKVTAVLLVSTFLLTGCWDKIEVENRAFVVAIGIDKTGGAYTVSITAPLLKKDGEDEGQGPQHIKTATGQTVAEAMEKLGAKTNKTLYYGQAKTLVLGEELLDSKEMTANAVHAIQSKAAIDLGMNVLAAKGDAKDILTAKPPEETLPGLFMTEMCRKKGEDDVVAQTLLQLITDDDVLLPQVRKDECEDTPLRLDGMVAVSIKKLCS